MRISSLSQRRIPILAFVLALALYLSIAGVASANQGDNSLSGYKPADLLNAIGTRAAQLQQSNCAGGEKSAGPLSAADCQAALERLQEFQKPASAPAPLPYTGAFSAGPLVSPASHAGFEGNLSDILKAIEARIPQIQPTGGGNSSDLGNKSSYTMPVKDISPETAVTSDNIAGKPPYVAPTMAQYAAISDENVAIIKSLLAEIVKRIDALAKQR